MRAILAGLANRGAADFWPASVPPADRALYTLLAVLALGVFLTVVTLYRREKGTVNSGE